ncbi:SNF2 domain-containing protein CLASSY 1-like protein protein [Tanacetum coccineum]
MEEGHKKRGGCVISHTPRAGKTLLIISFLVSYLKLFLGSRPLVLAPKTTLYTWYKEIIKWQIPILVYQIHGGQTYREEVLRNKLKLAPGLPRNQDVMHVLDYEGHNPRSTKSRLRKDLMKVDTPLRVLLSGTLFQNNFGEYFNTLTLARPRFVKEVLKKLDPKFKKRMKGVISKFSLKNRARKMFVTRIGEQINSNIQKDRQQGLNVLRSLTSRLIDNYKGGSAENLPGLQCYTLMMKSTTVQQDILNKLQEQRPIYKGFPLELELLITLGSIHPWLIQTTTCASQYFNEDELRALDSLQFDLKLGSKIRFVMSLVPHCLLRKEKVLIFCHNIAPINLFIETFNRFYGWEKGIEVIVLQGNLELFERGRVMDKFKPDGPSKVMLASINACAEGISLTAASRVILLDTEWNPSKSKQAIACAFRPGQDKVVYVYQLLAQGTLEEEKDSRTTWKEWVSSMIFNEELVEYKGRVWQTRG